MCIVWVAFGSNGYQQKDKSPENGRCIMLIQRKQDGLPPINYSISIVFFYYLHRRRNADWNILQMQISEYDKHGR